MANRPGAARLTSITQVPTRAGSWRCFFVRVCDSGEIRFRNPLIDIYKEDVILPAWLLNSELASMSVSYAKQCVQLEIASREVKSVENPNTVMTAIRTDRAFQPLVLLDAANSRIGGGLRFTTDAVIVAHTEGQAIGGDPLPVLQACLAHFFSASITSERTHMKLLMSP